MSTGIRSRWVPSSISLSELPEINLARTVFVVMRLNRNMRVNGENENSQRVVIHITSTENIRTDFYMSSVNDPGGLIATKKPTSLTMNPSISVSVSPT